MNSVLQLGGSMNAEVISIGDELTSGQRLDTNSQWISLRLGELGVPVHYHTTVADDLDANIGVFRTALVRADVIVVTGGLGPTADDLTREAIADATGSQLVTDADALEDIRAKFARRGQSMPQRNVVQALRPAASHMIPNPHGTAPGIAMCVAREGCDPSHFFALPGVPAELFEMWDQSVGPAISALNPTDRVIRHQRIKCFGVGESKLEQMLPDMIRRGRSPSVGITVSEATITLRVTADGATDDDCRRAMKPTIATIQECLGELVFGEEADELQHAVARLLDRDQKTLATAEIGTGGLITHWMNDVPTTDHRRYLGGFVATTQQGAMDWLAALDDSLASRPPDRSNLVQAMAKTCRQRTGADFGLAAGPLSCDPSDQTAAQPFYMAVAAAQSVTVDSATAAGHPSIQKVRSAKQALDALRLVLLHKIED